MYIKSDPNTSLRVMYTGITKLHMGLVVLMKMSVLINFPLQIPSLCQSLAKSAKILLVMSDRTDKTPREPRV
jgi:Na+/H+ antiporter NhaD/arsenite permease-like protein